MRMIKIGGVGRERFPVTRGCWGVWGLLGGVYIHAIKALTLAPSSKLILWPHFLKILPKRALYNLSESLKIIKFGHVVQEKRSRDHFWVWGYMGGFWGGWYIHPGTQGVWTPSTDQIWLKPIFPERIWCVLSDLNMHFKKFWLRHRCRQRKRVVPDWSRIRE